MYLISVFVGSIRKKKFSKSLRFRQFLSYLGEGGTEASPESPFKAIALPFHKLVSRLYWDTEKMRKKDCQFQLWHGY